MCVPRTCAGIWYLYKRPYTCRISAGRQDISVLQTMGLWLSCFQAQVAREFGVKVEVKAVDEAFM